VKRRDSLRNAIRLLVVDDHPAVREGLALLLSPEGIQVCATAGGRIEALGQMRERPADVAIVDLCLDGEDGVALVVDLKDRGIPALVYSMYDDPQHVQRAFTAGAAGYVTKSEFRGVLVEAIREVAAGHRFVSPKAAVALAGPLTTSPADDSLARLSVKEREVYRLAGQGEGTYEIARAMKISTHTVESYYARIQLKLGVQGMYELRRHAIDHFREHDR
jgi:DNA-binding NarL/FixJ family response regulator